MKVKTNYEGQEIWVEEEIKICLDELKREEDVQVRKNRRHELLWDSILIEEIETNREILSAEDDAINAIYLKMMDKLFVGLGDTDKRLLIDRFINKMKFSEMEKKYSMSDSTLNSRIKRIVGKLRYDMSRFLKSK